MNAFVGAMIGLERSILPELAEKEFQLIAKSAILFFTATPAVTIARRLIDTFSGIAPTGVPAFILAQFLAVIFVFFLVKKVYSSQ